MNGTLVSQLVGGTTTRYTQDLDSPLSQILGDTSAPLSAGGTNTYIYGLDRLYGITGTTKTWYVADPLGSVRATLSNVGVVGAVAHYDPYGSVQSGAVGNFGFTGELQQGSNVYLRARWYNAGAGSFGVRDPFEGYAQAPYSQHYYAYGYSNPVLLTDPSGKNPSLCLALVLADGPIPAGDVLAVICALYFASLTTAATATVEGVVPPVTNTGNTMPAPAPFHLPPFSWGDWQGSTIFSDPLVNDPGVCRTDSPLGPYEPGVLRTPPFPTLAQHGPMVLSAKVQTDLERILKSYPSDFRGRCATCANEVASRLIREGFDADIVEITDRDGAPQMLVKDPTDPSKMKSIGLAGWHEVVRVKMADGERFIDAVVYEAKRKVAFLTWDEYRELWYYPDDVVRGRTRPPGANDERPFP